MVGRWWGGSGPADGRAEAPSVCGTVQREKCNHTAARAVYCGLCPRATVPVHALPLVTLETTFRELASQRRESI
eukprot:6481603-Prymnesium_polylepis.2